MEVIDNGRRIAVEVRGGYWFSLISVALVVSSVRGKACANGFTEGPPMLVSVAISGLIVSISVSSCSRVHSCLSRASNKCSTGSDSSGAVS